MPHFEIGPPLAMAKDTPSKKPEKKAAQKKAMTAKDQLIDLGRTIAIALAIAVVIRSFLFQPFHIPSSSMEPGLKVGDYLIVTKYSYGYSKYSVPYGWLLLDWLPERIMGSDPQRGDVAVFRPADMEKTDYIKRVVGLPGDTLSIRDNQLYIKAAGDSEFRPASQERRAPNPSDDPNPNMGQFDETFPGQDSAHRIQHKIIGADFGSNCIQVGYAGCEANTLVVPQDHFFMMGDNRDNSQDSRFPQVRFVPRENLVGKAQFVVFSWKSLTRFFRPIR